jgi:hypothetical protein
MDNGSDIELEITTGRWNPYVGEGRRADLGWVDFLVERDPDISFSVDFYMNQESAAYLTETLTCDSDNNTEDKIWLRAYCGAIADFHKMRVYHTESSQTLKIHAICPWFKPAGRMI